MSTSINVNKAFVKDYLASGKMSRFVIPEYQRPYAWTEDQTLTLIEDLWEFAITKGGPDRDNSYFLGSIVSYTNENKEREIIDGQQRLTTLFLLLRAIHKMLSDTEAKTPEADNFIKQIEETIWQADKMTAKVYYDRPLLDSKVVGDEGNLLFQGILETGTADLESKDQYSKNYLFIQKTLKELASDNPMMMYSFFYAILFQAILLPITADNKETALTIFSTLNDRGLALSDADIFKAEIYDGKAEEERGSFIDTWKKLDSRAERCGLSLNELFSFYMFYLKAKEDDRKTSIIGTRKYYGENDFKRLKEKDLLENLDRALNLWNVLISREDPLEGEEWSKNKKIIKTLDILNQYQNIYWKYPVLIYYLTYGEEENFEENFLAFTRCLAIELALLFTITPTLSFVKSSIINLNADIIKNPLPILKLREVEDFEERLKSSLKYAPRSSVRMLLSILAYEKQDYLLPLSWDVEHIFPRKWDKAYTDYKDKEEFIKDCLDQIGNKLPIEKDKNIRASNNYFATKKEEYAKSKVVITNEFGKSHEDWKPEDIAGRTEEIFHELLRIRKAWSEEYKALQRAYQGNSESENQNVELTDEQQRLLEQLRAKGYEVDIKKS